MSNQIQTAATRQNSVKLKLLSTVLLTSTFLFSFTAPAAAQDVGGKIRHVIYCTQLLAEDALNGTNFHTAECGVGDHSHRTSNTNRINGVGTSTAPPPPPTPPVVIVEEEEPDEVIEEDKEHYCEPREGDYYYSRSGLNNAPSLSRFGAFNSPPPRTNFSSFTGGGNIPFSTNQNRSLNTGGNTPRFGVGNNFSRPRGFGGGFGR